MKYADLHLHTIFSDSTYTPEQLVRESLKSGLSCIAVCDHDTVDGVGPTIEIGKKESLEVIPGIELTAELDGQEIHTLGYFLDHTNKNLLKQLASLKDIRIERVHKITDKLNKIGIALKPQSVFDLAAGGMPGRLHIARALVKDGLVKSLEEVFRKYIGDNGPAYVAGFRFTPAEAMKLIKDFGGVPVLAHPYLLNNDELIPQFVQDGLMGLEVYYPEHSQSMINFYLDLAKKFNLLVTGGSDCHGKAKPEVKIGSIKIPYTLVEELKMAREKIK